MILVTGGTGLVGSHLLYFLLKNNEAVRAIYREASNLQAIKKVFALYTDEAETLFQKIEWAEADVTDIPALSVAFEGITHVYHCAAFISFDPRENTKLKKINEEGTANIVNLCLAYKVQKLCYVSSVATFGKALENGLISEETPWDPVAKNSVYSISKYGAEIEVWRGTQEGLDAVIVNPAVILGNGPGDSGSGVITILASKGIPFYPLGSMGIVDVEDVVKGMILLMNSSIKNEQFILSGENISYKKLLSEFAPLFNKKPPTQPLPKWVLLFFSNIDWAVNLLFKTQRKLVKATVRSMFSVSNYEASKIKKALGFEFTPYRETLKRVAANHTKKA